MASLNAKVVITGRNAERVGKVAKKCEEVSPDALKPLQVVADVANDEDLKKLVTATIDEFGQIDVLVNNAGFLELGDLAAENVMEVYEKIMATNLRAVVLLTHLCLPHLIESKGSVINISSRAGLRPLSNKFSYCISKAGLDMFTKCMAIDLGPKGVRVNSIKYVKLFI